MSWEEVDSHPIPPATDHPSAVEAMRSDLRVAKVAGFKVGYLGSLSGTVVVTLSCRIGKLGISTGAMEAWDVRPTDFLVLLIRYRRGYTGLEEILDPAPGDPAPIRMQVGLCDFYKPGRDFRLRGSIPRDGEHPSDSISNEEQELRPIFTGRSIEDLLNGRFVSLVKHRLKYGFSWTGAEQFFNVSQGSLMHESEARKPAYRALENWDESTPGFLVADHLFGHTNAAELSFPLIAIQYTLRRFVKCSEFCLSCYCKVDAGFEAIKPYVCSKPLCLYQYMQLGMGPSIEWEIRSQPYVVDMLISFAYAQANSDQLTDFPSGLEMKVPGTFDTASVARHPATFDNSDMTIVMGDRTDINVGDWILISDRGPQTKLREPNLMHCCVRDTSCKPRIHLSAPVLQRPSPQDKRQGIGKLVEIVVYDANFDDLKIDAKRAAIVMLLETLPSVDAMASFINSGLDRSSMRPLERWQERISPSALYALRWIVASNRSCIIHDDNPEHQVSDMKGYLQFRLAQGAPDKEQRFVHSVNTTSAKLGLKHPTLFAWHGSVMHNWHSILREGLHFKTVVNGRSCGHGVYMARDFRTSRGYSGFQHPTIDNTGSNYWPHSKLQIEMAISLNEVVNAPQSFVHSQSSVYVVSNLDWIQPRYLFIQCRNESLNVDRAGPPPSAVYAQDPEYRAHGPDGQPVTIPISALSSRQGHQQHFRATNSETPMGSKQPSGQQKSPEAIAIQGDDDTSSVATLDEDREFLQSDEDKAAKASAESYSKTDFRPGALQESSLELLGPPTYATPSATRALQQRLQETLKVQAREPLHELGWYINKDLINNVYQWIAELHSFDPSLPIARDLRSAGLTSIVLEIRFPPEFPFSPPFVRVIRPRVLPFSRGGGGHVTAGGAMCMELLTSSGWSAASSIESVLLQVRMAITNTEPQPARLEPRTRQQEYSVGEAVEAYKRVCYVHGWRVPDDIQKISWQ